MHARSDDEFTDDEDVSTPLDAIDPWVAFADTLAAVQAGQPARHQAMLAGADAAAMQTVLAFAQEQRAAAAKAAAGVA